MGDYYDSRARARGPSKQASSNTNGNSKDLAEYATPIGIAIRPDKHIPNESSGTLCRACSDFQNWKKAGGKQNRGDSSQSVNYDCPLDRSELGRHTWNFLHTMAAYYPQRPSKDEQEQVLAFFDSFGRFYPCDHCAEDFRQEMRKSPPRVTSRWELSTWLCEQHNLVNKKLGKSEFDCSKILERWLTGPADGSCS